jgi:hypothetical protein
LHAAGHPAPLVRPLAGPGPLVQRQAPVKGPWPAPVVDPLEPVAAKYAADWPGWGHRKIYGLLRADSHTASCSSVRRALRRRGLLQPVDYTGARRALAKARRAAFAQPPTARNQGVAAGFQRVRDQRRRDPLPVKVG